MNIGRYIRALRSLNNEIICYPKRKMAACINSALEAANKKEEDSHARFKKAVEEYKTAVEEHKEINAEYKAAKEEERAAIAKRGVKLLKVKEKKLIAKKQANDVVVKHRKTQRRLKAMQRVNKYATTPLFIAVILIMLNAIANLIKGLILTAIPTDLYFLTEIVIIIHAVIIAIPFIGYIFAVIGRSKSPSWLGLEDDDVCEVVDDFMLRVLTNSRQFLDMYCNMEYLSKNSIIDETARRGKIGESYTLIYRLLIKEEANFSADTLLYLKSALQSVTDQRVKELQGYPWMEYTRIIIKEVECAGIQLSVEIAFSKHLPGETPTMKTSNTTKLQRLNAPDDSDTIF